MIGIHIIIQGLDYEQYVQPAILNDLTLGNLTENFVYSGNGSNISWKLDSDTVWGETIDKKYITEVSETTGRKPVFLLSSADYS